MRNLEFPVIGTRLQAPGALAIGGQAKVSHLKEKFDVNSPAGRKKYFRAKAGDEISHIKKYLKKNTFIAYFLGKKGSGKGTYSKLLTEIFGEDKIKHISIGDIVRDVHKELETKKGRKTVEEFLHKRYRGYISVEEGINAILGRSTEKVSVPNEVMLALIEREIDKHRGKALFIDGFPRTLDQVSYSLYFRDLMGYRDDPDIFALIDIPESVIDARIKTRVICPECFISRNTRLFPTSKIGYDKANKEFFLICDNSECKGYGRTKLVAKEGDHLGIEPIRSRLMTDEEILRTAFSLHGVPKVLMRNHVLVSEASKYFDEYELTPEYIYKWNGRNEVVEVIEKPWTVKDDNGKKCYSLLPAPVVVSFLKQLPEALDL